MTIRLPRDFSTISVSKNHKKIFCMRIVFWSNFLSPHTLPFVIKLKEDKRVDDVVFVAAINADEEHKEMGWNNRDFPGIDTIRTYISPTDSQIDQICGERPDDSWHIFPGFGDPLVSPLYQKSLKYDLRQVVMSERPMTYACGVDYAKPLWLHRLRFFLKFRKYAKQTQMVFAMGSDAVTYFKSVFDCPVQNFGYCTFRQESQNVDVPSDSPLRCCFVGSLSRRKNPLTILKALHYLHRNRHEIEMTFIGDGSERQKMEHYISDKNMQGIEILGFKDNSEIPKLLTNYDVLILPSIHDGWGAVVNEAMQAGCFVVCSDNCGAKDLLDNQERGYIFKTNNYQDLASYIDKCLQNKATIRFQRQERLEWAESHLSGEAFSQYLIDCICGVKAEQPWNKSYKDYK